MLNFSSLLETKRPVLRVAANRMDAIKQMVESGLPALAVYDKRDSFVGILSARELLRHADEEQLGLLLEKPDPRSFANQLADQKVLSEITNKGYSAIFDSNGRFQGIIYIEDILRKLLSKKEYEKFPIEGFVRDKFSVVWASAPVGVGWCALRSSGMNSLLVVDDSCKPFSVFSELDVLAETVEERVSVREQGGDSGVSEEWGVEQSDIVYIDRLTLTVSNRPLKTFTNKLKDTVLYTESVASVATKMVLGRLPLLPVVDSSKNLMGVVYGVDLLKILKDNAF
jgi:CBS domain-containing protein